MADIFAAPFAVYVLVGFCAQIVDGALGMAYGTLSMSVLLAAGVPPATASASVHTAQFFTTGISGMSHAIARNVNWRLCLTLAAAGIVGGVCGAVFLTKIDADAVRPWIAAYLMVLGIVILIRLRRAGKRAVLCEEAGLQRAHQGRDYAYRFRLSHCVLGFCGGGLDAAGGGGWGPVVTSNLLAAGGLPRYTIGSVNLAEFFVKTAIAAAFFAALGPAAFHKITMGLLLGGIIAAPLGALLLKYVRAELLMGAVGWLIVLLSLSQIMLLVL